MSRSRRIVTAQEAGGLEASDVGGKALQLGRLTRAGFAVPSFFSVTSNVFDDLYAPARSDIEAVLARTVMTDRARVREASAEIATFFAEHPLRGDDRRAILDLFDETFTAGAHVAVRSSALGEDSSTHSFAGQLDTFLFVTRADVCDRVLACFASAFSERALVYRHIHGLSSVDVRAAAVVQEMIDAASAGILFTANPTSGDRSELIISAGYGLGEGVVGGTVESDTYYVGAESADVRRRVLSVKKRKVVFDDAAGAGTTIVDVPSGDAARSVLGDPELKALVDVGVRIAALQGTPQDIEWAIDAEGHVHVLQARDITTLASGQESVFDNSNVVESYPGISLPLTYSFVRKGYEILFKDSARLFGVPEAVIAKNHATYANLLALLDGRIYYNISNWYGLFLQIPGFERAVPAWEKALGIEPRFARPAPKTSIASVVRTLPMRLLTAWRLLRNWFAIDRMVRESLDVLSNTVRTVNADLAAARDVHWLLARSESAADVIRRRFAVAVLNDFLTQQLYALVGKLIVKWSLGDEVTRRNALLCGEAGMHSVEPVHSLVALVPIIRDEAPLRELFASGRSDAEVWRAIHDEDRYRSLRAPLARHVELYGDRTLEELKLEVPSLAEAPHVLIAALRNYLRVGRSIDGMEQRERAIRRGAEDAVTRALDNRPLRRAVFFYFLDRCRWGIKSRENLRLSRSRAFGAFKRVYRAFGDVFAEQELIDAASDIFWLTADEIAELIRGASVTRDLRGLIKLRKSEYADYAGRELSPRVVTHGIVYKNTFARERRVYDSTTALMGIGCSPGRVTAPAKVILQADASAVLDGEILVAASTDPGWVFLMVAAGGLVSEKGSVLSHTAIIGRELGIPTVVGVADATQRIVDGARIELDGEAGTVRVLGSAPGVDSPAPGDLA